MVLIKASEIAKVYATQKKEARVLEDLSFEINKGEIISLLGKSGCGKSTLLNIVGGFIPASSGEVFIDGHKVIGPQRKCIMLFQHNNLLPWRSVLKNVELGLEREQLSKAEKDARVMDAIRLVDLEKHLHQFPRELSGGMQQRVAIARALAIQPDVILMDEPFAALDTFNRYLLQDELLRIQEQAKTTIMLVTHDIDEAVYLSDRILMMSSFPGTIYKELKIDMSKPRDRADSNFNYYRKLILEEFEFGGAQQGPEFMI